MKQDKDYFDFHLLVCTNARKSGEDCCQKGAEKMLEELKPWVKDEIKKSGKNLSARVNKSGCLGRCSEGIVCVAYPEGEWFTDAKVDDVEKIKTWIREKIANAKG